MRLTEAPDALWARMSSFIADTMGLHFPRDRWGDLQRGIETAAREAGAGDVKRWMEALLVAPPDQAQLERLASHLTIGETYFFRDKPTFEMLAKHILPKLITARRSRERRLRLWSAACCTGEEAYSLAMLLHELLPDLTEWRVTILATDINPGFLRKAVAGIFGEWSFRAVPSWVQSRYCTQLSDGRHAVRPEVKRLVSFASLNLVDDMYPLLATDTNAMDVILCRNVLMYFAPAQIRKVVGRLHRTLVDDGWLVVSPSEASHTVFAQFATVNAPGVILYHKSSPTETPALPDAVPSLQTPWVALPLAADEAGNLAPMETVPDEPTAPAPSAYAISSQNYDEGRYVDAVEMLDAAVAGRRPESREFALLVRALGNQGRLDDALVWCERWIKAEKLDATARYLRAVVLFEKGATSEAHRSLQEALYLQPDFVLAHVTLGHTHLAMGQAASARQHFANALRLLTRCDQEKPVPESDGLTAGRLAETLSALLESGAAA